jgi:hypothetical protein
LPDFITIEDRQLLHNATIELVECLKNRIAVEAYPLVLNNQLLQRLIRACFRCPGFTQAQKDDIAFICELSPNAGFDLGLVPFAPEWKWLRAIGPKPGVTMDVLLVSLNAFWLLMYILMVAVVLYHYP